MAQTQIVTVKPRETFAGYGQLEVLSCWSCGILYAVPEAMLASGRNDPSISWYCPNGHNTHFPGKTVTERLAAERNRAGRIAAERDQLQASLRSQRAATTRARNERDRLERRAKAGVCPCCQRTFKQLRRHIASQHPDFTPGEGHAS